MSFTPGPWSLSERDPQLDEFYVFNEDSTACVATVVSREDPDEHEANARLIAAAPELFDALKGLCAVNDAFVQVLKDFLEGCLDHRDHLEIGYSLRERATALLAQYGDEQ